MLGQAGVMGFVPVLDFEVSAMKKMRAKFQVTSITHMENGAELKLLPVTHGSPENEEFFKWTPGGEIKLGLLRAEQVEGISPGQQFYVDLTPAAE